MIEDRELENWRGQWTTVAELPTDFQHKVRERIKRENRLFVVGNVLSAIAFLGILFFAAFVRRHAGWLGTGWATGLCILVFVSVGCRIWVMRQTWRPETQSTRAFVELWHKRVVARLRLLGLSIYVSIGWIIFCAGLTAANWPTIGQDVRAHPREWIGLVVACALMQPVIWYWASWLRRRKLRELDEVSRVLREMEE